MSDSPAKKAAAVAMAMVIAAPAEGLRQWAYRDPVGILTVCYGSTSNVQQGRFYPLDECKALLSKEMREAVDAVDRCAPNLPPHQLAAWGDAVFNLGPKIVCDPEKSTAARMLKRGLLTEACDELPKWNKGRIAGQLVELPGLTKRREKERQLCLTGEVWHEAKKSGA